MSNDEADSKRLTWLIQSGATVGFSRDGDDYWLHWPYHPDDEEGDAVNQSGIFEDPREAIDAAMRAEARGQAPWRVK